MFSMCSELTPRADVPDNRIPQLMQPCSVLLCFTLFYSVGKLVSKGELLKCSRLKYETWSSATTLEFRLQQLLETEKLTTPVNPDHWLFVMIVIFQHPENRKI